MTYTRLLVLGQTHAPDAEAAHLASAGMLRVQAGTYNHVPASMVGAALAISTAGATRLLMAGVDLPLLSPGPAWLSTVPGHFLGRKLVCTTLGRFRQDWQGYGEIRLAEHRHGLLGYEGGFYSPEFFIHQLTRHRTRSPFNVFLEDIHVIASVPVKYTDRYRVFIANGEISASTRLTAVQDGRRNLAYEGTAADQTKAAEHFARKVVDATVWHQPPGFRIDVGTAPDGSWQLISAGPSWDAEFLEANPTGVVSSILAGQAPDYAHWKWTPDEFFRRSMMPAYPAAGS